MPNHFTRYGLALHQIQLRMVTEIQGSAQVFSFGTNKMQSASSANYLHIAALAKKAEVCAKCKVAFSHYVLNIMSGKL